MAPTLSVESFLAFVLAMSILSLTPGPGFLVVVARFLTGGIAAGLATITGLVIGDLLFLALAILGLSALAMALGEFFLVVKLLGAAYLVWLGIGLWRSKASLPEVAAARARAERERRLQGRSLVLGFLVTLANPKTILFYSALVPTFIDVARLNAADVGLLGAVVAAVSYLVLGGYGLLALRAGRALKSTRALVWLNRITGGLLVGAGVAVATR